MTDAFSNCALELITLLIINEGLTMIGDEAFVWTSLECITILSTVTEIGDYAFGACGSLREFLLHDMG
jgi:hypothetical protein